MLIYSSPIPSTWKFSHFLSEKSSPFHTALKNRYGKFMKILWVFLFFSLNCFIWLWGWFFKLNKIKRLFLFLIFFMIFSVEANLFQFRFFLFFYWFSFLFCYSFWCLKWKWKWKIKNENSEMCSIFYCYYFSRVMILLFLCFYCSFSFLYIGRKMEKFWKTFGLLKSLDIYFLRLKVWSKRYSEWIEWIEWNRME